MNTSQENLSALAAAYNQLAELGRKYPGALESHIKGPTASLGERFCPDSVNVTFGLEFSERELLPVFAGGQLGRLELTFKTRVGQVFSWNVSTHSWGEVKNERYIVKK